MALTFPPPPPWIIIVESCCVQVEPWLEIEYIFFHVWAFAGQPAGLHRRDPCFVSFSVFLSSSGMVVFVVELGMLCVVLLLPYIHDKHYAFPWFRLLLKACVCECSRRTGGGGLGHAFQEAETRHFAHRW